MSALPLDASAPEAASTGRAAILGWALLQAVLLYGVPSTPFLPSCSSRDVLPTSYLLAIGPTALVVGFLLPRTSRATLARRSRARLLATGALAGLAGGIAGVVAVLAIATYFRGVDLEPIRALLDVLTFGPAAYAVAYTAHVRLHVLRERRWWGPARVIAVSWIAGRLGIFVAMVGTAVVTGGPSVLVRVGRFVFDPL